uniref:Uncharacterized protein n=1 Tax=Magallana gigas TaxID=29159 RepID=A0A8W8ITX5_MAGGI
MCPRLFGHYLLGEYIKKRVQRTKQTGSAVRTDPPFKMLKFVCLALCVVYASATYKRGGYGGGYGVDMAVVSEADTEVDTVLMTDSDTVVSEEDMAVLEVDTAVSEVDMVVLEVDTAESEVDMVVLEVDTVVSEVDTEVEESLEAVLDTAAVDSVENTDADPEERDTIKVTKYTTYQGPCLLSALGGPSA